MLSPALAQDRHWPDEILVWRLNWHILSFFVRGIFSWVNTLQELISLWHQGWIRIITRKRTLDKWDDGNADLSWHKLAMKSTNRALISQHIYKFGYIYYEFWTHWAFDIHKICTCKLYQNLEEAEIPKASWWNTLKCVIWLEIRLNLFSLIE